MLRGNNLGKTIKRVNGCMQVTKKIENEEELEKVQKAIVEKVRKELYEGDEPYRGWESANIMFLAFNPL